ncbi:MAG: hypothetical protein WBK55_08270 [Alphaproteobacteria bacterium]
MPTIEEMLVQIEATTEGLRRELKKGDQELGEFEKRTNKRLGDVEAGFQRLGKTLVRGLIPTVTIAGTARFFSESIKDMADLADEAERAGVSAERLQAFQLLGQQVGLGFDAGAEAVANFNREVAAAREGGGKLFDALINNNIALRDAEGNFRSAAEVLDDYVDLLARTEASEERLLLARQGFGKGGDALANAFKEGSAGLQQFQDDAIASGLIIDNELIAKAEQFDDAWKEVLRRWEVRGKTAALGIATAIDEFIKKGEELQLSLIERGGSSPFPRFSEVPPQDNFSEVPGDFGIKKPPVPPDLPDRKIKQDIIDQNRAREESMRVSEREAQKIQDVIDALKFRNEQVGLDNEQQDLNNQLRSAGVTLYSAEGQEIEKLVDHYSDLEQVQKDNAAAAEFLKSTVDDAITGYDDLRTVALKALGDILKATIDLSYGQKPANSIGGFIASSLFDFVGSGFSFSSGYNPAKAPPPMKPQFHDYVGPYQGGKPYSVGVPEIFIPSSSGTAYPLDKLGKGDTYHIYAPNADREGLNELRATIKQLGGEIKNVSSSVEPRAIAAVSNHSKRSLTYLKK